MQSALAASRRHCASSSSSAAPARAAPARRRPRRAGDDHRLADGDRRRAERLRDLRAVPAPRRPVAVRLDVKRQDRVAGRAGQPDGARLRDARRAARAVDRERRRRARPPARAAAAPARARRRATSIRARCRTRTGAMMPRDPLAVEVLAGHDDDAAVAEVERRGQDAAVPEREDRLAARPRSARRSARRPRPASVASRPSAATSGYAAAAISGGLRRCRVRTVRATRQPSLHALVLRPSAAFGRHPVDDLIGIHDVARLAVDAVRRVDLQLLRAVAGVDHLVDVRRDRSACTGLPYSSRQRVRQMSVSWTIRCDG